jgi:hypothetical protein
MTNENDHVAVNDYEQPKEGADMYQLLFPDGGQLICPSCGNIYLHHDRVEVFEREQDMRAGVHVIVAGGKLEHDDNLTGNPSPRRHGLTVHFRCEDCSVRSRLNILQHKGSTYLEMIHV